MTRFALLAFILIGCAHTQPVKVAPSYGVCGDAQFVTAGDYLPPGLEDAIKGAVDFWNGQVGRKVLFYTPDLEESENWITVKAVDESYFSFNTRGNHHPYNRDGCIGGSLITVKDTEDYYEKIMIHEIGHALGLRHSEEWKSLMYWEYSWRTKMELGADSVAELKRLYGVR